MFLTEDLEDFRIPLENFKRATNNFDSYLLLDHGVYRGELVVYGKRHQTIIKQYNIEKNESHELEIVSRLHHEDIISFIGYCDGEDNYIYVAYEYFAHKSLDDILKTNASSKLRWAYRLDICIKVAKVLNYLNSDLPVVVGRAIHGDVKCENILINPDNLKQIKVSGFKHSKLIPIDEPHQHHYCPENLFEKSHTDPIYKETNLLNTESDVYSFGVVMFQILHGTGSEDLYQLINLVRGSYDDGPYKLVDPYLIGEIDHRSLQIFTTIAHRCISFDTKERPEMDEIIKTIVKALDVHNYGSALQNLQRTIRKFEIPLEDIRKAIGAEDFDRSISSKPPGIMTHRGMLVDRYNEREAFFKHWTSEDYNENKLKIILNELLLISSFHHENITPFIGFYAGDDIIIASEYAHGSLYSKLETQSKDSYLTWEQRLKICLGAARGLKCFHAGFGEHKVIHGDFNSKNILLFDNLEAKISGFGKSFLVPRSYPDTTVYKEAQGSKYYMDPVYRESRIPRVESNVYSFGVVLFEILTGFLACSNHRVEFEQKSMINWVRHCTAKNDIFHRYTFVDNRIRDEIYARSLDTFKDIAYKCISFNMKDRPSMNQVIKRLEEALYIQNHGAASTIARENKKLEDFRIPLKDINLAIGVKGQETLIGEGGFGVVYKGQPSDRWQNRTIAIKCLHPKSYQGDYEFRNELNIIFNFSHEHIIPFIGYCDEGSEKIIVSEYARNGSLDSHITDKNKRLFLTWENRLKICLGAAKGHDYLHSGLGEENRVIHRDVKSGNILLDHNLVAKVCDFGLSKSGPIIKQHTQVYTKAAGTNFYMDPVYHEGGVLRKESDVYSFGVVMFELLSGMLAYNRRTLEDGKLKPLINIVRRYYDHKPDLIIDPLIKDEIDNRSFNAYREVAFQCISFNSKERPTMEMIVDRVEEALELQVTNQGDLKQKVTES